ncbi:hypothetical protein ACFYXM_11670 [Streptomyces sp. NPDC002476]|uniref:hypothetical protein n=1 Tax=Streptomyces sp. NPDC002476 TaxID=3364648 RepID=UPI0036BE79C4
MRETVAGLEVTISQTFPASGVHCRGLEGSGHIAGDFDVHAGFGGDPPVDDGHRLLHHLLIWTETCRSVIRGCSSTKAARMAVAADPINQLLATRTAAFGHVQTSLSWPRRERLLLPCPDLLTPCVLTDTDNRRNQ